MASLYLNPTPPNPAWLSPALSVLKSSGLNQDGRTPILDVDPVTGEWQLIQAVAGNTAGGSTFLNVHVQLWAMAFTTGAAPSLYLDSLGGTKGITIPAGTAMPIDIGPNQQQPFSRHWDKTDDLTSTNPQITSHFVNGEVHCCILGNVYHPSDPGSAPIPDDPNGPLNGHLHPDTEPRHAQCNMTIKAHSTPQLGFHMFAGNPDGEADQVVELEIAEHRPRKLQTTVLRQLDALGPWIRRARETPEGGIPGLEVVVGDKVHPLRIARTPLKDLGIQIRGEKGHRPKHKLELGAHEARPIVLDADVPDEDFTLRVLDVVQTNRDGSRDGARVMLVTAPQELLAPPRKGG